MARRILAVLRAIGWCCLVAQIAACSPDALDPLPPGATVLAFGDSLTYGTGAPPDAAYPAALAAQTGLAVINAGVPGEISAEGNARIDTALARHQPDLVVLIHGGNDTLKDLPTDVTKANMTSMIRKAQAAGSQVIMFGVPGRSLTLSTPGYYDEVARELEIHIDTSTLPRLMRSRELKSDPVHFNAAGSGQLASAVRDLLITSGAIADR